MNNVQILKLTEGLGGEYLTKEIIKRSKDKNIIYLTEDVLLNTKCVQELAKYLENLIQRNKNLEQIEKEHKEENGRLRDRINKTINKLNEDISDDNCMWVNNQEKIVNTAKTIIDRSNYAKEILELLEESEK